jgi:iron-sulfur cluster repair protein YtfE (RIC family)
VAIKLGARPEHGFDQPLGLLSDCHRRIESFLAMMIRVVERCADGRAMADDERRAMEAALQYFQTAAPRHTQDEEQSLFPRLRESDDPDARAALARVESLEEDHRRADAMHERANRLSRQWLDGGTISAADLETLRRLLQDLRDMYARHIALEDTELFPLAARVLDAAQLGQIGSEMAQRRGLPAGGLKS